MLYRSNMLKIVTELFIYCVGYDAMGYELAKPRLRAELENDLKLLVLSFSPFTSLCTQ